MTKFTDFFFFPSNSFCLVYLMTYQTLMGYVMPKFEYNPDYNFNILLQLIF